MNPKSKILPKIAIVMILFSVLLANFSFVRAQQAQPSGPAAGTIQQQIEKMAQQETTKLALQNASASEGSKSDCSLVPWKFNLKICAAEALAVLGNATVWIAGLGLDITENLFNFALHENLNPARFDPSQQKIIGTGWGIIRDLVNMLFIFILLIIAIAVIIGWETYGIKKALPTFIIIILLINFSLLFTRYVIEFSNTLGEYLYCQALRVEQPCYNKDNVQEISDLFHMGLQPWKVLETYKEGEYKQNFLKAKNKELEDVNRKIEAVDQGKTVKTSWFFGKKLTREDLEKTKADLMSEIQRIGELPDVQVKENIFKTIFAATVFGSIILIVAAFVFLSAAILLIIRIVILWILMIFAPAALLLWALPATAGYGRTWLNYLLNQAFFFPVLIFFLFLSIQLVTGDLIKPGDAAKFEGTLSSVGAYLDPSLASRAITESGFLFNYAIVIVLLLASLHFARSMASHGASQIIVFGDKARGYALGAAKVGGQYAWGGASYWPRYGASRGWEALKGRITRPPELEGGKYKLDAEGKPIDRGGILERFGRTKVGGLIPGYRRLMQEARAGVQENIDEHKKNLNRLGNYDLKQEHDRVLTVPQKRVAIEEILAERKDMSGLNPIYVKEAIKVAEKAGRSTGAIERLGYQWGEVTLEGKLSAELRKGFEKMRPQNLRDIVEEGGDAYKMFMRKKEALSKETDIVIKNLSNLADAFEAVGNKATATWLRNKQAEDLMKGIFVKEGSETKKTRGGGGEYDVDEEEFKKR